MGTLSSSKMHALGEAHAWLRLVTISMAFLVIAITLGVCYGMASSEGHLDYPGLPSISALGDHMPEHVVFAVGFALVATCMAVSIVWRMMQLDSGDGSGKVANICIACVGWLGCPFLIVMGAIPDSSSAGVIHFISAGIAMGTFAIYLISASVFALVLSLSHRFTAIDARVPRVLRICCYIWSIVVATISISLFLYWMMGNQDQNEFEWAGVAILFVAFLPYCLFFSLRSDKWKGVTEERTPLVHPASNM